MVRSVAPAGSRATRRPARQQAACKELGMAEASNPGGKPQGVGEEAMDAAQAESNAILKLLSEKYHEFGRQTKRLAEYVLRHPRSVALCNITELAEQGGVSQFTVTSLCKSLGLSGYKDFKAAFSRTFVRPLENIHEEVSETDQVSDVAHKLAESHCASIRATEARLDAVQITRTVDALEKATRLHVYGMGSAGVAAQSSFHKFFRLGLDIVVPQDAHVQVMTASLLCPGDVAIGISTSGRSKEVLDAIRQAKAAGAVTVAISSYPGSPLVKACDLRIISTSQESLYRTESMENLIAQIYILDILYVSLAMRKVDVFLDSLEKTRKSLVNKKI
jgi:DNA-binding MurR/RpiR family transcriptional regulator